MTAQLIRPLTSTLKTLIHHSPLQTHPLEGERADVVFEKGKRVFKFWNKKILFTDEKGLTFTVYQRDDIFDKTEDNKRRMADGNAPLGEDGNEIELHHLTQTYGGPLAEVTRLIHRDGKLKNGNSYSDILHGCPPEKLWHIYKRWAHILGGSLPNKNTERRKDCSLWILNRDLNLNPTTFIPASKRQREFKKQKEAYWMERGKMLFG
ncbi:MAG: HNH/ENDO VII family nuclease [Vampirovibrionales bacterium]